MVAVKWITFPPTSLTILCDLFFWVSNKKNLLTGLSPKIISLSTKQFTKVQIWEKIPHKICIVMIRRRLLEEECYHHLISLRWDILLISSFSRSFVSWVSFFFISDILLWCDHNPNTTHSVLKIHIYRHIGFYVFSLFVLIIYMSYISLP